MNNYNNTLTLLPHSKVANFFSILQYWATDLENRVATECLQLHGGWGYMMDTGIARSFIDARVQSIYGGSNEIMKELIARTIVKPVN